MECVARTERILDVVRENAKIGRLRSSECFAVWWETITQLLFIATSVLS